ncbi:hypothetical protein D3C72_2120700 [compost metagenome]
MKEGNGHEERERHGGRAQRPAAEGKTGRNSGGDSYAAAQIRKGYAAVVRIVARWS